MITSRRNMKITLAAMTLASSMILVDQTAVPLAAPHAIIGLHAEISQSQWLMTANILPLAALMVFGGRLGDLFGMRRVFLIGAVIFALATTAMGASQDIAWAIVARAIQGTGAALMMPTALAIVSAVYPDEEKGAALGILAGASAFFAALGPVLGGVLTSIDWRLVFLVNVPLAVLAIFLTLRATPKLEPDRNASRDLDLPGVVTFALAIGALIYGISEGPQAGWGRPGTIGPIVVGLLLIPVFLAIERRSDNPMINFKLFRHENFLAANLSQLLAGMIELGLGFLTPFFLLLVVGVSPTTAGIALIPATIPVILAGPLSGKAFDRFGGRWPLFIGFLVLAASGIVLAVSVSSESAVALIPGLLLQGLGLGIVLTVNDPTGLTAVPDKDSGEAAGMINTSEQLGGALGIAILEAIELGVNFSKLQDRFDEHGIHPTAHQSEVGRNLILEAEQKGLNNLPHSHILGLIKPDLVASHVTAFEVTFYASAGIAVAGAVVSFVLVRKRDRVKPGTTGVFTRRSRWIFATSGRSPAITRRPAPRSGESATG
ncbi:MAG TPA: DHA2 family efflux MFS transporter permease subunit [Solirubrobacterales bacterium]|jgi:EmrB/QacA subfamily drug resistance transporter|nr:DHA2 family efflux MFS transporter permease subunit [Solirubrobacterales bacterium]